MSPDSNNSASAANDSASAANDSASAANDSASAANDSASAANDSASAANVFYMPTQRKRRQIHNANGKKRISFPMAALHILWQEMEEYLGVRGSYAVVTVALLFV
ncbi:hypothetical protein R3I94_000385 [Phoxinus phoxinus]